MDTLQTGIFDRFYDELGLGAAEALGALGNCEAKKLHRGPVYLLMKGEAGRRDATLTVARYPAKPETLATENPSNGLAADFIGKVRFRGHVQFDQGAGGILNFEQLLALFPVGFQLPWHDAGNIPTGWAIMNGTANSVGNGGSGINKGGRVDFGYIAGDPTFGTLGATVSVALTWSGAPIATAGGAGISVTTDGGGSHDHTVAHTGVRDAITISAHAAASGGPVNTNFCIFGVADGVVDPVFDGTTAPDSDYTNDEGTPGRVTIQGHRHNITHSAIAAAIAGHTISAVGSPSSITTSNQPNHTHGVTIPDGTITAGLVVNTPNVVRPPGIVTLWIEKLA